MSQTVLITGASSGIGRATAQYFAQKGWNVSATSRHPESESIWGQPGSTITPRLDVTNEASIASAITATIERFGRIDAVINNAGYGQFGPLEGTTAEQFEAVFRTNVFGTANVIRQALPHLRKQGGTIVNVSSVAGLVGTPFLSAYHATKFAIEGFSESLRFELQSHNIRLKLIEPGFFKTDFFHRGLQWVSHNAYEKQWANSRVRIARSAARAKDPVLVAETIYEAVSDESDRLRYVVNGGLVGLGAYLPSSLWRWIMTIGMNRSPRIAQTVPRTAGTEH